MKTHDELMKLTKVQLEEYGRTFGVEIDRRKKKGSLVGLLIDVQELCKPKKPELTLSNIIEAYSNENIETSDEQPTQEKAEEDKAKDIKDEGQGFFAWFKKLFS